MVEQGLIRPPQQATYKGLAAGSKSGEGGSLRARELAERDSARPFVDLLSVLPPEHVPTDVELEEIWFVADYRLNYEKVLGINDPVKLTNIAKMLRQIVDVYTVDNALGELFLGVIASKLGDSTEAQSRIASSLEICDRSAYWRTRFSGLGLFDLADSTLAAVN